MIQICIGNDLPVPQLSSHEVFMAVTRRRFLAAAATVAAHNALTGKAANRVAADTTNASHGSSADAPLLPLRQPGFVADLAAEPWRMWHDSAAA